MNLEEQLEQEALALAVELTKVDAASEEYKAISERLRTVQATLSEETKRMIASEEHDEKRQQMTAQEWLEEQRLKQSKRDKWWQVGIEVVKGLVFVVANGAIIFLGIAANNSGEVLPPMASRMIQGPKLKN